MFEVKQEHWDKARAIIEDRDISAVAHLLALIGSVERVVGGIGQRWGNLLNSGVNPDEVDYVSAVLPASICRDAYVAFKK
jgi:hypothetical protein